MNKSTATIALTAGLAFGLIAVPVGAALATQPDFICPETGNGWIKFDGIDSPTAFATAPDGSLIAEVCYKAGTNQSVYLVGPVASTLIVSTLLNNGGQVADISHYSIRLVPVVTPTPEPTVTSTPEPTLTPTPEPTRTTEPTPFPPLEPPTVPGGPVLAPTGLEEWFWFLLAVGVGLLATGWRAVRRTHDSTTTGEQ